MFRPSKCPMNKEWKYSRTKKTKSFLFPDFDNMRSSKSRGYYMHAGTRHHVFDCEYNYSRGGCHESEQRPNKRWTISLKGVEMDVSQRKERQRRGRERVIRWTGSSVTWTPPLMKRQVGRRGRSTYVHCQQTQYVDLFDLVICQLDGMKGGTLPLLYSLLLQLHKMYSESVRKFNCLFFLHKPLNHCVTSSC
jgi:hypothetical protein